MRFKGPGPSSDNFASVYQSNTGQNALGKSVKIGLMLHSQSLPDQKKPRILRDLCLLSRTLGAETDEVTLGLTELLTVSGAIEMKVVPVWTS